MRIVPVRRTAPRFLAYAMGPGAAPPPEEEGGASATDIIAAAATLAALTARLGVPAPDSVIAEDSAEVVLEIDAQATTTALVYEQALPGAQLGDLAVTAEQLAGRREQLGEMLRLYGTATQFRARLSGTRQAVRAAQRRLLRRLLAKVRGLLDDESLPRTFRDKLASDAAELLQYADKLQEAQALRKAKTQKRTARIEEKLGELDRQKKLLRTMLDLRSGKEVDPAEAGEALDTFEALSEKEERRRAPAR